MASNRFIRREIIYREDGADYMVRWHILHTPWFRIYLHKIILSDFDCPHDHPWNFLTIMLKGSYREYSNWHHPKRLGCVDYKAPCVLYRPAEWSHRLEVLNGPVWTLVFLSSRKRKWGFWTKKGWVHWKNYKSTNSCE